MLSCEPEFIPAPPSAHPAPSTELLTAALSQREEAARRPRQSPSVGNGPGPPPGSRETDPFVLSRLRPAATVVNVLLLNVEPLE